VINRALQAVDDVNLEEDIIADTSSGEVRYRNSLTLAKAPGEEEHCRENIISTFIKVQKSGEIDKVANTYNGLNEATVKARRAVEEISLLGFVPGHCRVCRRLGI